MKTAQEEGNISLHDIIGSSKHYFFFFFFFFCDPSPTSTLDPLSLLRNVASLPIFYWYYFGHCSDEVATCISPPMARPHSACQASFAHNYYVELSNARINQFSDGFFPSTSRLWNSLPSVFPASFKRQVLLPP